MKKKTFKHGKFSYRSYLKPAGKGYEVGFHFDGQDLFIGNFVHSKEANQWYSQMNKEIKAFTEKYWITPDAPKTFYRKFFKNHLHKIYYKFLDKTFAKYNREFDKQFTKDLKHYKNIKKEWQPKEKIPFKSAA